jgi:hypothetical protein
MPADLLKHDLSGALVVGRRRNSEALYRQGWLRRSGAGLQKPIHHGSGDTSAVVEIVRVWSFRGHIDHGYRKQARPVSVVDSTVEHRNRCHIRHCATNGRRNHMASASQSEAWAGSDCWHRSKNSKRVEPRQLGYV